MDRVPIIGSSNIVSVGYEELALLLEVETKSGLYAYRGVPPEVHAEIMQAESVGRTFNALVVKSGFTANILCETCRRWHPKGECPPGCQPDAAPECGTRKCGCTWAANHGGPHVCTCGRVYGGGEDGPVKEVADEGLR